MIFVEWNKTIFNLFKNSNNPESKLTKLKLFKYFNYIKCIIFSWNVFKIF